MLIFVTEAYRFPALALKLALYVEMVVTFGKQIFLALVFIFIKFEVPTCLPKKQLMVYVGLFVLDTLSISLTFNAASIMQIHRTGNDQPRRGGQMKGPGQAPLLQHQQYGGGYPGSSSGGYSGGYSSNYSDPYHNDPHSHHSPLTPVGTLVSNPSLRYSGLPFYT